MAKRVLDHTSRDAVSVLAAGCAFFALFAFVPGLSALVALYALLADPATVQNHMALLQDLLPEEAYSLVLQQTTRIVTGSDAVLGWGFLVSLAIALWSANQGTKTLFTALNVVYRERERRGFLRFNVVTLAFTLAGIVAAVLVMVVLVWVPIVLAFVGTGDGFDSAVRLARWPLLALLVILWLAFLYGYGPARETAKLRWLSPGAVLATVVWLLASWGFSIYVEGFADYDAVYGSLGAVVVLMFWLYLSFFIVLLGAELNAALELQTARDTTTGADKPMGERGAYVADHVAAGDGDGARDAEMSEAGAPDGATAERPVARANRDGAARRRRAG